MSTKKSSKLNKKISSPSGRVAEALVEALEETAPLDILIFEKLIRNAERKKRDDYFISYYFANGDQLARNNCFHKHSHTSVCRKRDSKFVYEFV